MQIDRKYIDDHHLVPRYLADQLSDTEREAFEAYYLAHPEALEDMEAVARLKTGLQELQRSGELPALLKSRKRIWRLALAAGVAALVVAASVILVRPPAKRPLLAAVPTALMDETGRPLPVFTTRYVMRMRSGGFDAQLQMPRVREAIELRILPEQSKAPAEYTVQISRIDEMQPPRRIGDLGELRVGADGYVAVYLDSAQLSPGVYELRLRRGNASSSSATSIFLLHVLSSWSRALRSFFRSRSRDAVVALPPACRKSRSAHNHPPRPVLFIARRSLNDPG